MLSQNTYTYTCCKFILFSHSQLEMYMYDPETILLYINDLLFFDPNRCYDL